MALNSEKDKNKKKEFMDNNSDYVNLGQEDSSKKKNLCWELIKDYLPFSIVIAILVTYFVTFYWEIDSHGAFYY